MSNKKDASTSTKPSDETTSTDSDSYHTAQGSAQNIEELAPLPWRSGVKAPTSEKAATPPPTPPYLPPPPPPPPQQLPPPPPPQRFQPTPPPPPPSPPKPPSRPSTRASSLEEDRPQTSVFSNRSAVSYNPSIFGEGPSPTFDDELRRGTVAWPQTGCIYIPLNPHGTMSNETLLTENLSDDGSKNRFGDDRLRPY